MSIDYHTSDLDYRGIVAGVYKQIDLIGQIDARIPDTGRKVSVGQATQAMVFNGLGFVGRALCLTPEFYKTKPVDLLAIFCWICQREVTDDLVGLFIRVLQDMKVRAEHREEKFVLNDFISNQSPILFGSGIHA